MQGCHLIHNEMLCAGTDERMKGERVNECISLPRSCCALLWMRCRRIHSYGTGDREAMKARSGYANTTYRIGNEALGAETHCASRNEWTHEHPVRV